MRRVLAFAAATEALTGLGLLAVPSFLVKLLFNAEVAGTGAIVSRVAGIALLSLGVACWPAREARAPVIGMLVYNLLVASYLLSVALQREHVGTLLWPVVLFHGAMVIPLSIALRTPRSSMAS